MHIPESLVVTDQDVDLTQLTAAQKRYFLSLARHLRETYVASGLTRYVVGVSGPSGSGKSVLSAIVAELLQGDESFACTAVELDAFHYSNAVLRERELLDTKGRYDTYDTAALQDVLCSFKQNNRVVFPRYSRQDHEPHPDGPVVPPGNCLLLLPGLWLQRDDEEWSEVRNYIDYTISIDAAAATVKQNTINRHVRGGRSLEDAEAFYNSSDLVNTDEIIRSATPADLTLPYFASIESDEEIPFLYG